MVSAVDTYLYDIRRRSAPGEMFQARISKLRGAELIQCLQASASYAFCAETLEQRYGGLFHIGYICNMTCQRWDVKTDDMVLSHVSSLLNKVWFALQAVEKELKGRYLKAMETLERNYFIEPWELMKYITEGEKGVMIFDFRRCHFPQIVYYNLIRTVSIDPETFLHGKTGEDILRLFGIEKENIVHLDFRKCLIILLGDELNDAKFTLFNPETKCRQMFDALIAPPLHLNVRILKGGISEFYRYYPMHVKFSDVGDCFLPHSWRPKENADSKAREWTQYLQASNGLANLRINEKRPAYSQLGTSYEKKAKTSPPYGTISRYSKSSNLSVRNPDRVISIDTARLMEPLPKEKKIKRPERKSIEFKYGVIEEEEGSFKADEDAQIHDTDTKDRQDDDAKKDEHEIVKREERAEEEKELLEDDAKLEDRMLETEEKADYVQEPRQVSFIDTLEDEILDLHEVYDLIYNKFKDLSIRGTNDAGMVGLSNMGNTCFINATLQALFSSCEIAYFFCKRNFIQFVNLKNQRGTKGRLSACMEALLSIYWSRGFSVVKLEPFYLIFKKYCPHLCNRRQHDAPEFLTYLLSLLHEDVLHIRDSGGEVEQNYDGVDIKADWNHYCKNNVGHEESPIAEIFNFVTACYLQCEECGNVKLRFDEDNQIKLDLPSGDDCKLSDCLEKYFETTMFDELNKRTCSQCGKNQKAQRSEKLWTLPPVLIIVLKRFQPTKDSFKKNMARVEFDMNGLDMSQYLHENSPEENPTYSLHAITEHTGSLTRGHYVAFVKNEEAKWVKYDDERCYIVRECVAQKCNAYILYYVKNTGSEDGGSENLTTKEAI